MSERLAHETRERETIDLGALSPAGSRHSGRRSAVALTDGSIVAGTAAGDVLAYDRNSLAERWRVEREDEIKEETDGIASEAAVVSMDSFADGIAVGERSPAGEIRLQDAATGEVRWRYSTAEDVGDPQRETRFFLPFVVSLASRGERLYAAARRYERGGGSSGSGSGDNDGGDGDDPDRSFESCIYAFERDGTLAWRQDTDASPIALETSEERVAVAFNRCPGDHQQGLVVLDAETGERLGSWDPVMTTTTTTATTTATTDDSATSSNRRVGDVSLLDDGLVCTSHADYRAYRLDGDCEPVWSVDLATEKQVGDEILYAYPNHCHATERGAIFLTGNTYPVEGRETDARHPDEHTAVGYTLEGERRFEESVGGFLTGLGTDGNRLVAPAGQNFRTRDPATHGLTLLDVETGRRRAIATEGIASAAALDGRTLAAIEEPVTYHDDGERRGAYRLHVDSV
jgi:outer membrane protein assembly factor BamB